MSGLISNGTYALGANIGEVSTDGSLTGTGTPDSPLGVNETVLYSIAASDIPGDGSRSFTLSEDYKNFEYLRIYFGRNPSGSLTVNGAQLVSVDEMKLSSGTVIFSYFAVSSSAWYECMGHLAVDSAGTTITEDYGAQRTLPSGGLDTAVLLHVFKVVGINRTASSEEA